ncbi:MAG: diaminopimelate decarboxylase [Actinobacteria bacterium]|nr:diaminopimelate decarboxylase [Actinomycetota bacterium]
MTSLPLPLLPDNASVGDDGQLLIAGCKLVELAEEYGTPLFVYDEEMLRERCREAVAAFGSGVDYATKAFLCKAMARLAHEEGMKLDVSTGGEYAVARAAGVPASALVLHGNNKSVAELRLAMEEGVSRVIVDSFDELDRLEQLVDEGLEAPKALVRITPGIEAHTHEYVQTGQDDSKFGFGVHTGAADEAIRRAQASTGVHFWGLHVHIGSQIFDEEFFDRAVTVVARLLDGTGARELSVGGGLGVAYIEGEAAPTLTEWAKATRAAAERAGVTARIVAEPGRSIVAAAGVTLYTVGTIKHIPGIRTYLSVDGGMSDNPRPVLYGSGYETFLPREVEADRPTVVTVVGKHCESGDVLVRDGHVPADIRVGDILCTPVTGAYGHSMGSNYNKVPRPAVVFVRDGEARIVVRRETYDDLMRLDV